MLDDRQARTGWLLIVIAGAYVLWFLKARLLMDGPPLTSKEWTILMSMSMCFLIGTVNVRMAAEREEKRKLEKTKNSSA